MATATAPNRRLVRTGRTWLADHQRLDVTAPNPRPVMQGANRARLSGYILRRWEKATTPSPGTIMRDLRTGRKMVIQRQGPEFCVALFHLLGYGQGRSFTRAYQLAVHICRDAGVKYPSLSTARRWVATRAMA
ncbi:MAG: hypothetical protein A3K18_13540 [Lentisphaerae bacterium RIFOXYA12_64_32]|nr:MAG: hypothetical protein A3K18_13540 [Lentisphaerae bacterium RIFOXYA12_64_32]